MATNRDASTRRAPLSSTSPLFGRSRAIPSRVSSIPSRAVRRASVRPAFRVGADVGGCRLCVEPAGAANRPALHVRRPGASSSLRASPAGRLPQGVCAPRATSGHRRSSMSSTSLRSEGVSASSSRRLVAFVHGSCESHFQASRWLSLRFSRPVWTSSTTARRFSSLSHITRLSTDSRRLPVALNLFVSGWHPTRAPGDRSCCLRPGPLRVQRLAAGG